MLIQQYLRRIVIVEWSFVFTVLLLIMVLVFSTIMIHELGIMPSTWLVVDIALGILPKLMILITPLSVLIGLILAFYRMSSHHELLGMCALGFSVKEMRRAISPVMIGLSLMIGITASFIQPLGIKHMDDTINQNKQEWLFQLVAPDQFSHLSFGQKAPPFVVYAKAKDNDRKLQRVFISSNKLDDVHWSLSADMIEQPSTHQKELDISQGLLWVQQDGRSMQKIHFDSLHLPIPSTNILSGQLKYANIVDVLSQLDHQWAFKRLNGMLFPACSVIMLFLLSFKFVVINPKQMRSQFLWLGGCVLIYYFARVVQDKLFSDDVMANILYLILPYALMFVMMMILDFWRRYYA